MDAPPTASDEVADLCSELIRFDTSNFGPEGSKGEREATEYVAAKLAEVGIESELFESEHRRTSLVAHWEPDGCDKNAPPLLIHGHTDVVPAIASEWQVDPFAGEVRDGYVWGRGAVDMKDFDAILLAVVRDRQRTGRPPRRPIRLVFTADEEAGGAKGAGWLAKNHPELIADCSEAIGEVGGFSLTVNDKRLYLIQTAEKGLAWLNLIATGTAGHGSMRNDDNAITELAGAVSRVGNYRWPQRLRPSVQAFLEALEDTLGTQIATDDVEQTLARLGSIARMVGATMSNTANPTMLAGGYKLNVIPGEATAGIDGRFIPGFEQEFYETITELIGDKVRYEVATGDIAVETTFDGDLVNAMTASLAAADPGSIAVPFMMSAGTDAKAWAPLGVRCFGFAPLRLPPELDFVALFHGVDERVPIESLQFGCQVLDDFLDRA
ncbi:M20/M25/M40 family metallo-hydrolase [Propionicimonas sp.]|uniref:M20/M25/M40 family metallo-hydrolase n=1 Tax=Propionicimonas sp. TaxID=1955623 RepID=UPI0018267F28|nr:M20/M25/M40 family metallo-hydrolase [Propionicimonas sp.]MBU3976237.1 M20/M25/M40 family metallo-hydrolase [Actinomycetota bacterium]MBA3021049.1 M20/M25/M40 family metallo-hydrolase [Propionicimonas sp.]MBU3985632.1 M20/M25/M40 family metallo-hydrolase [Actinomycetota bacterium]MBU4008417.1 M20/M25/M40 family metallo-hydrolase [Actinomycetota bacterium]MBU4066433.1 M20/M25/M40 family metallo-hydrolase [Actinomycetota bacterium]